MKNTVRALVGCMAVACVLCASVAMGTTYYIDPGQSTIALTGNIGGIFPLTPQTPGSHILTFDGTVDADDLGVTLNFTGAAADALLQADPQMPDVGGVAGSAPADAGLLIGNPPGLGPVAVRDFLVSITGAADYTAPNFDLTDLTLTITTGSIDYNVPAFTLTGSEDLSGTTAMPTAGTGTLIADTLTIPIAVSIMVQVLGGDTPEDPDDDLFATVNLDGQIVAMVPEPGSIAMLAVGLVGLAPLGWRRLRATSRR